MSVVLSRLSQSFESYALKKFAHGKKYIQSGDRPKEAEGQEILRRADLFFDLSKCLAEAANDQEHDSDEPHEAYPSRNPYDENERALVLLWIEALELYSESNQRPFNRDILGLISFFQQSVAKIALKE